MQDIKENSLSIRKERVAQLKGSDVYKCILQNDKVSIVVTNLGCSIISIDTPDRNGICKNIVAGFVDIEDYLENRDYFGCVVGRFANRIAKGKFALDGKQFQLSVNNDTNHLHGGLEGFHSKIWDVVDLVTLEDSVAIAFSYSSKDGEEGYPGNVEITVTYSLNQRNELSVEYVAQTDKATPVNMTNHSYFNLTGFVDPVINNHLLQVNASYYTEKNERNLLTGAILPVAGTSLDFIRLKKIGTDIDKFPLDFGYDHNFVLEKHVNDEFVFAAQLYEAVSGRVLKVFTSQPGLQVYTANYWDGTIKGFHDQCYQKHAAVALETQSFPDSPNHLSFPNSILRPGDRYHSKTIYAFSAA